jgi:hypothetical protein
MHTEDECYGDEKIMYIRLLYISALLFWFLVVYSTNLYKTDSIGLFILSLPLVLFLIAFIAAPFLNGDVEEHLTKSNMLSVGLLLTLALLAALEKYTSAKGLAPLMILAIVFTLLSLLDIWLPSDWISIQKHLKSILQVLSITLLVFILYMFFRHAKAFSAKDGQKISKDFGLFNP